MQRRPRRNSSTDSRTNDQELVDRLEEVWASIDSMCANLTDPQWKTPTDLPGWSGQDNVVHISAIESSILGRPAPDHTPPDYDHVKNEVGQRNEVGRLALRVVRLEGARRVPRGHRLPARAAARLHRYRLRRRVMDARRSRDRPRSAPVPHLRLVGARARHPRVVDQPCDLESPVADLAFERVLSALPYVVGKKVGPPDGTTVVFDVSGSRPQTIAIGVEGGRAKPLSSPPEKPSVTLAMDAQTLACLGLGRWDPAASLDEGQVTITGDDALGRAVVGHMNFMF